jgi:hypothetical protein
MSSRPIRIRRVLINPTCAIKKTLGDIYHLETTDFNRWALQTHECHLSSFHKHHIQHVIDVMFLKRR